MAHEHSSDPSTVVNDCEMRVIGLQRSGNHPIIYWIMSQCNTRIFFLSDVRGASENPYATMSEFEEYNSGRLIRRLNLWDEHDSRKVQNGEIQDVNGVFGRKELLIYNHEDQALSSICTNTFEENHDRWLGPSRQRFDILIMRDPFNLFASRMKAGFLPGFLPRIKDFDRLTELWKEHATEYLSLSNLLPAPKVCINFNEWFTSTSYRAELARTLGLQFSDTSVNAVPEFGGGSSFDGLAFQGRAQQMQITERWKEFKDDARYRTILADVEMLELSARIFGNVGTDIEIARPLRK
ncbi:MAG: hypothetical protein ABI885_29010 [Gammaproteobacteria bacterium]